MTPERHARVQQIFEAALDLPVQERNAYLDEACGGDVELRLHIKRLLRATDETASAWFPAKEIPAESVKVCPVCNRCFESAVGVCDRDGARLDAAFPGSLLIDRKYLVERRLGRGGMGAVYLVLHTGLRKRFALKLILTGGWMPDSLRKNFEHEAQALGRLKHPHIVDVTDYGVDPRDGGLPYLVMEYLEGATLREALEKRRVVSVSEMLALLRQVAKAVDFAHSQKIIHGDLKPANLFLVQQGETQSIKVVDFGLARMGQAPSELPDEQPVQSSSDHSTASGTIWGTAAYMAPELLRSEAPSRASDLFALGALWYEVLTGKLPFGANLMEVATRIHDRPARPSSQNPALPPELDEPLLAMLDATAENRPASASEAVRWIEQAWLSAQQRHWRAREIPPRLVYAGIIAVVALVAAGLIAGLRVGQVAEQRSTDARFAVLPQRAPTQRLLLITVDEAALANDPRPLTEWHASFADMIERLFSAGARAVALDLLLPTSWSGSKEFGRVVSQFGERMVLGLLSSPSGEVIGYECVGPLTANLLGPERYSALFGFVNLEEDEDGAIRRARLEYRDRSGQRRASFAARAAAVANLMLAGERSGEAPFRIDLSVRPAEISKVSWKEIGNRLNSTPDLVRDRLVIVGADYPGSGDHHRLPVILSPVPVPGVLVHGLIVDTIAASAPVRDASLRWSLLAVSLPCFAAVALTLCIPHRQTGILLLAALLLGYFAAAFGLLRYVRLMIALIGPMLAIALSAALAWFLKMRLAPYPTGAGVLEEGVTYGSP